MDVFDQTGACFTCTCYDSLQQSTCTSHVSNTPTPTMPSAVCADDIIRLKYQGYDYFCKAVSHYSNLQARHRLSQNFIEFSGVSYSEFKTLVSEKGRPYKSIKFSYDSRHRTLLVRLMPGWDHEATVGVFRELVSDKLAAMRVKRECLIQSSPTVRLGPFIKEPDTCWGPKATGVPKFVLEVGALESSRQLAVDARRWLESPGTPINAVTTIHLGKYQDDRVTEKPITIKVYLPLSIESRNMTRSSFESQTVTMSRSGDTNAATFSGVSRNPVTHEVTETDQIILDFDMFVGRFPSGPLEHDVILTRDSLLEFAEDVWEQQRNNRNGKT